MSAEIETMVSANNIIPWHKQGNVLAGYPSLDIMYQQSGLDWEVEQRPLLYPDSTNGMQESGYCGIVRKTDDKILGLCSSRYTLYQNKQAFDWCQPLIDSGLWKMETAGALRGGKNCWALLNQGEQEVVKGDKLKNYLLLNWSHDGSSSVFCGLTSIRVVCNNTLRQALSYDGDSITRVRHTSKLEVRLEKLAALYQSTQKAFEEQTESFKALADTKVSKGTQESYIDAVLAELFSPLSDEPVYIDDDSPSSRVIRRQKLVDKTRNEIQGYVSNGSGMKELKLEGTAWGLFNGVEEWLEKSRGGNRIKDRGYDTLFGSGGKLIDRAYQLIAEV